MPLSSTGIWSSSVNFAAAVDLPVGQRIRAQVVRRKGPLPARQRRVLHHRLHLRLNQRRIEEQEERRRGIEHVHGRDAAVGEVLLGKQHRRAVDVRRQPVRGQRLPVGQDGELRVLLAAGLFQIGRQLAVELLAARFQARVFTLGRGQHLLHGLVVALPVGAQLAAQVLDVVLLGVGQQQMPRLPA